MAADGSERRLAAILAADVVGYSRQVAADEAGTLARLRTLRTDFIEPLVAEQRGRLFKTLGDGFLIEFASAVQAMRCALALQTRGPGDEARMLLRVGVHQGDLVIDGGDLLGDGVNIAARLGSLAEPGGICVSARVWEDAAGKIALEVTDLGKPTLKNIDRPIQVYRVHVPEIDRQPIALPDKPSLVVLPFQNMSGDPDQEYLVDGLVEDITTALSRLRSLFVIARNSAFTYKGRAVDVRQVGRELGVRYVLEGSVRKSVSRIRITGQLIDAMTGVHVWADRFDGPFEDVFDLQDRVTSSVAGAIEPHLQRAEIERAQRKPTEDLGAYDYYLRAVALMNEWGNERLAEANVLFAKAWTLDPGYGAAYAMAAYTINMQRATGALSVDGPEIAEAKRLALLAATTGRDDPTALRCAGAVLAYSGDQLEAGLLLIESSCALNPNSAEGWNMMGWVKAWLGYPDAAIAHIEHSLRLSPLDPHRYTRHLSMATAHFFAGRYKEAASWAERAVSEQPRFSASYRYWAASLAMCGRLEEARRAVAGVVRLAPQTRLSNASHWMPRFRPPDYAPRMIQALRKAGLPE